jgi:acetolactate synthase-1/2/3 large subunit
MDLSPTLDFVALARGMGVIGVRIEDADALQDAVRAALAAGGPRLVEVVVSGKQ